LTLASKGDKTFILPSERSCGLPIIAFRGRWHCIIYYRRFWTKLSSRFHVFLRRRRYGKTEHSDSFWHGFGFLCLWQLDHWSYL
jgi:hypothetical protein